MKIRKYENRNEVPNNDIKLVNLDDVTNELENIRDLMEDKDSFFTVEDLINNLNDNKYD